MSEEKNTLNAQEELMRRLKAIGADLWGNAMMPGRDPDGGYLRCGEGQQGHDYILPAGPGGGPAE